MTTFYAGLTTLFRRERLVTGVFFGLLLVVGLVLVGDYGISLDESQQRNVGLVSLKYVCERLFPGFIASHENFAIVNPPLHEFVDRDYGVAFEMTVVYIEQAFRITGWDKVFLFRHICTFLVCFGGVIALYQLARRRFGDWRLGLLGAGLLVVSPRMFAESFYNDKDMVFMAVFVIATNTAVALVARPTWQRVGWHALACACCIDVRVMGILLPLATLFMLGLQASRGAYRGQQLGAKIAVYLVLFLAIMLALWPYLWEAPLRNFGQAFENMSKFRWDGEVLYQGNLILATSLPWHYAPVWIGITTPVLYLVGFLVGAALILWQLARRGWRLYATEAEWQDLFFLGLTLAPVVAVIVFGSVLYDGWRQLYFLYPSLLLVALRGLVALGQWPLARRAWPRWWPRLSYGVLAATLLATAGQMVAMHPLQNTYFNVLPGRHLEERFEIDYWVLSYRQALEWIARHDSRAHIAVVTQLPGALNITRLAMPDYDRDRLEVVTDGSKADYFITTYRWHPQPYYELPNEMTSIRCGGQRILSIFRTKW